MSRRVDFLVAGVQKGGTTALYEYMKRDLPVSLAKVKEAHFFDDETQSWSAPDYAAYDRMFDPDDDRPRGEATPIYIYWPNCLERIAAYNPKIRLILIFRDPVERAWSHWRMERARGFDDASFSWAIREGRARLTDNSDSPGFHRVFSYVERGFYGAQFAHALTLFPRDQILALKSNDLKINPTKVLNQVAHHLHLDSVAALSPLEANIGVRDQGGPNISLVDKRRLTDLYSADLENFSNLSGLDIGDWRAHSSII